MGRHRNPRSTFRFYLMAVLVGLAIGCFITILIINPQWQLHH